MVLQGFLLDHLHSLFNHLPDMKKFNAGELLLLMLGFCVTATILTGIVGIVIKGSANPSEATTAVRTALIDLLKYIAGGLLTIAAQMLTKKKEDER
jgi:cytochrome b subunit of formate dehydrogenase